MSGSVLVINADGPETRVALIESGIMTELYIERRRGRGIAGNIYKGKVVRVLPGMQAAFVDLGLPKAGFLHVSDFHPGVDELPIVDEDAIESAVEPEDAAVDAALPVPPVTAPETVPEFSV